MPTTWTVASYTAVLDTTRLPNYGAANSSTSEQDALIEPDRTREGVPREAATGIGWSPIRLLEWYAGAMEKKPLLVKILSSGILGALGNLISQCIFWTQSGDVVWHDEEMSTISAARALRKGRVGSRRYPSQQSAGKFKERRRCCLDYV